MYQQSISAVIMVGNGGDSPQEQLVLQAQRACALDFVHTLLDQGIAPIIVAAPTTAWVPPGLDVICDQDRPGQPFHFGQRLSGLISDYHLSATMYFGGGSTPLIDGSLVNMIAGMLHRAQYYAASSKIPSHIALTNNLHSSDWLALTHPLDALAVIQGTERDNSLAWLLNDSGEYEVRAIAKIRPAAGLDLDTPTDLALVAHHPGLKPRLAAVVQDRRLHAIPVQEIISVASQPETNVTLIGRVSPLAWQALNKATSCWVRVFAEERGMTASGRLQRGEVRSMIGEMLRARGAHAFFQMLSQMTDAAIIDSRPLMAALGHWPTAANRFASDLYLIDQIEDPWLQEFTAAAAAAPIPILLGGHSVVAGGLYALVEIIEGRRKRSG